MRIFSSLLTAVIGLSLSSLAVAQARRDSQTTPDSSDAVAQTTEQAIDRIIVREQEEITVLKAYHPIVETYVQVYKRKGKEERRLARDYYYLGQADLAGSKRIGYRSMLLSKDQIPKKGFVDEDFRPAGFAQMAYVDPSGFDRKHYSFAYVGREFLGDIRCVVFDVKPQPDSGRGRFFGRIWAEEKTYAIVHFNGIYIPIRHRESINAHFDSWRLNVQPGLWLPTYTFVEETDLRVRGVDGGRFFADHLRFKAQTRFWAYNLKGPKREDEFSSVVVDSSTNLPIKDESDGEQRDRSPLQAERNWQSQSEDNALAALERAGLLAPTGEVDKLLGTVVNNLEVTNNLSIEPPIRCRVLMTATFDLFRVGHVIVVSRGLLDVLPDEGTVAAVLADEMGEILVSKVGVDRYAFYDIVQVPSVDALRRFSFKLDAKEREQSGQKALGLLRNSPYKDDLGNAGLFLKQFEQDSGSLRALSSPHLGNGVYFASELVGTAPPLQRDNLNQVAALPLGARVKLDPWTDKVELLQAKPLTLLSPSEKMPLEIVPLTPYLTRYPEQKATGESTKVAVKAQSPGQNK